MRFSRLVPPPAPTGAWRQGEDGGGGSALGGILKLIADFGDEQLKIA